MKLRSSLLLACLAAFVVAAGPDIKMEKREPVVSSLSELSWMIGEWERVEGGKSSLERWRGPEGDMMFGMSRELVDGKVKFFEYLRIAERNGRLAYVACPVGRGETVFLMVEIAGKKAVFENVENDFPKRITYWLAEDGNLNASIWGVEKGEEKTQSWNWKKVESK